MLSVLFNRFQTYLRYTTVSLESRPYADAMGEYAGLQNFLDQEAIKAPDLSETIEAMQEREANARREAENAEHMKNFVIVDSPGYIDFNGDLDDVRVRFQLAGFVGRDLESVMLSMMALRGEAPDGAAMVHFADHVSMEFNLADMLDAYDAPFLETELHEVFEVRRIERPRGLSAVDRDDFLMPLATPRHDRPDWRKHDRTKGRSGPMGRPKTP